MAEQETRHVHASQSREKVEAPDLPAWSLFGMQVRHVALTSSRLFCGNGNCQLMY